MKLTDVGRSVGNRVLESVGRAASRVQETRPLPTDVLESEDAYLVVFDAPGATKSDVQVRYVDGVVEVRIDRFREFYDDYEMRVPGRGMSLDGRARLPADAVVEASESTATLRANGTLEVRVPKGETEERDALDASAGTVDIATPEDDDRTEADDELVADEGVDEHETAAEAFDAGDSSDDAGDDGVDAGDEGDDDLEYSAEDEDVHVGDETDPLESGTGEEAEDFDVEGGDDEDDENA